MQTMQHAAFAFSIGFVLALPHSAFAQQKFPTKPIRIIVGSAPAGTPDILARLIGSKMSESWGQAVVIENRQPALVAHSAVAKATPDGYTLLLASPAFATRAALFTNLPFDTVKDFAGVTEIGFSNTAVLVGAGLGVKSIQELVAFANARPGKVFSGTGVVGGTDHLNVERFKFAAGIKAQHVAFKGQADALLQTVAGRSHFTAAGLTAAMPLVNGGKLIALLQRVPGLPGVPTAAEVMPDWKEIGAQAIWAPAGTPLPIRQRISKEVARILSLPDIRERLETVFFHIEPTTPEEQERKLRADIATTAKIIKDIGLKPN